MNWQEGGVATRKRVVVTGATGLIGKAVCDALIVRGYDVVVFSRDTGAARQIVPGAASYVAWTPTDSGPWTAQIDGAFAVISLAGASIGGQRWTPAYKQKLRDTRVLATQGLVQAMAAAKTKPQVFISGSAVGYYGARDATALDENAAPGTDFLAGLVQEWEAAADKATALGVRTVLLRSGIVLDPDQGALAQLARPFRFFVGGPVLPGTQYLSWIHLADEVGLILWVLENEAIAGPLNATAPHPQTNRDFSAALGKALWRPSLLPVPGIALKLLLGEFADSLTTGQRVIPKKALEGGYQFKYPTSEAALQAIYRS